MTIFTVSHKSTGCTCTNSITATLLLLHTILQRPYKHAHNNINTNTNTNTNINFIMH